MSRNYTFPEIRRILTNAQIVSSRVYELLPDIIRANDPLQALKGFFGAVQEEYDRDRDSINDILLLVDPKGINNRFILSGSPSFLDTSQFLPGNYTTNAVIFDQSPPGIGADDFYNGFGVSVWTTPTPSSGVVGQYRRIVDYSGATKVATLDVPWSIVPETGSVVAMCYPDRIWLPTEIIADPRDTSGSVLPDQAGANYLQKQILLPNLYYISNRADYYKGWRLHFLDGDLGGQVFNIDTWSGDSGPVPYLATVSGTITAQPQEDDWFKLIPPDGVQVSTTSDFYKDRFVRVLVATQDKTNGYRIQIQSRRVLRSVYDPTSIPASHVCYIAENQTGDRWEFPPDPTGFIGVVNHYVSLGYLARQIGWTLDAQDPEELQREQIRQAFSFYRLKGTKRAIELICRSFGLIPSVEEQASTYTHAPDKVGVGPAFVQPPHLYFPWEKRQTIIQTGLGEDEVPPTWRTTEQQNVRIPDSDIKLYLSRLTPKAAFGPDILNRILAKIEDVRPIHVEIVLVGFLQVVKDEALVTEDLIKQGLFEFSEPVGVTEGFAGSPTGTDIVPLDIESTEVDTFLIVFSDARYDTAEGTTRYDISLPLGRYEAGLVYFSG